MKSELKKALILVAAVIVIILVSVETTYIIMHRSTPPAPAPAPQPAVQATPAPLTAQIISIKPHMVSVTTTGKVCHNEQHTVYTQNHNVPVAGAVLGGVAGGTIANQTINGSSRTAATVAGAALGALGGAAVQKHLNQPKPYVVSTPVCTKKTTTKQVQQGFEVTYIMNGQTMTAIVREKPTANTIVLPPVQQNTVPTATPVPATTQ